MANPPIKNSLLAAAMAARKAEKLSAGTLQLAHLKPAAKTAAELAGVAKDHRELPTTYARDRFTPQEGQGADENRSVADVVDRLANRAHAMDQVSVETKLPPDAEPLVDEGQEAPSKFNPAKAGPKRIKASALANAATPQHVADRMPNLINGHIERLAQTFGTSRFAGAVEMLRTDKMVKASDFRDIVAKFTGQKPPSREEGLKSLGVTGELLKTQKPKRDIENRKKWDYVIAVRKHQIKEHKRALKQQAETERKSGSSGSRGSSSSGGSSGSNSARLILKVE
ncbi:hypothetical protein [Hyphomicrobium sp.]|uniref:hypothetical protein n=1 Tax=Hyphomicrobium sp. TaxID=82 RepID=UPI001D79A025|nr:hypothetical protein [Hyphomicrobium sp.]MBY0559857.1 hypothetical protein [Hyphomicrobium sp.]